MVSSAQAGRGRLRRGGHLSNQDKSLGTVFVSNKCFKNWAAFTCWAATGILLVPVENKEMP